MGSSFIRQHRRSMKNLSHKPPNRAATGSTDAAPAALINTKE
jgi:hypothetical protein